MSGENISTNMGLPVPATGVTSGPDWADDYNASLNIIDAHTHAPGSGIAITPSGMNINADLSFGSNSATALLKGAFTSQSSALTGTNFLSFVSGNLYVNDGSGNQIPITSGGGVAGSPGSIGSLSAPASATYSSGSKLFTWQSGASKAAAMDNGSVTIRETDVTSAKGITLQSPTSLAADYSITLLTALPGSTQALNMSSSGAMGTISYDGIGSGMTSTGANDVATSRTRTTGTSVGAGGVAISSSSGIFVTTSTSYSAVTNLSVTIVSSGRPIMIMLTSAAAAALASLQIDSNKTGKVRIRRNGVSTIGEYLFGNLSVSATTVAAYVPSGGITQVDAIAAGTYTYTIEAAVVSGSATLTVADSRIIVYEL